MTFRGTSVTAYRYPFKYPEKQGRSRQNFSLHLIKPSRIAQLSSLMSYAYGSTNSNEFLDNQQQNSSSSSIHSNYGPVLGGQREYPSPAPSMSSVNAPSPSAYSFPEGQIESQIGPSIPNRIMTRGQRKAAAAMNAGVKVSFDFHA